MAKTTTPATGEQFPINSDVLELAELDRRDYKLERARGAYPAIPAWHPRNDGEGEGSGEGAGTGTGDGGGSGEGTQGGHGTGDETPTGEDTLPDAVKEVLRKERARAKAAEGRASAAERKVQEQEDAKKSELQRTQEERDREKGTAAETAKENLKLRIAIKKSLPFELLSRLQGGTEEELEADADVLLGLVKPKEDAGNGDSGTGFDGGERGGGKPALTQELIEKMSPTEINARWDEIQAFAAKK